MAGAEHFAAALIQPLSIFSVNNGKDGE